MMGTFILEHVGEIMADTHINLQNDIIILLFLSAWPF